MRHWTNSPTAPAAASNEPESVTFGPFSFHLQRGELRQNDEHIRITEREREMLRVLASGMGETLPREALAEHGTASNERTIDVQISRLRRKLENTENAGQIIKTVRGAGYVFVPKVSFG